MFISASTFAIASNYSQNSIVIAEAVEEATVQQFLEVYNAVRNAHQGKGGICETTREEYEQIMEIYQKLSANNRENVKNMDDPIESEYKIGHMLEVLVSMYSSSRTNSGERKEKLTQSTAIIIVVVVSIVGMSAISTLFILKKDNLIE